MIKVAIVTFTAGWQHVLEASADFEKDEAALAWVNEQAQKWYDKLSTTAIESGGVFKLDEDYTHVVGSDMAKMFDDLRYTPSLEANGGEELFMAVLDKTSQARIYEQLSRLDNES